MVQLIAIQLDWSEASPERFALAFSQNAHFYFSKWVLSMSGNLCRVWGLGRRSVVAWLLLRLLPLLIFKLLLLLLLCCFPTNNFYLRGVKAAISCSWSRGRWRRWRCDHLKTEHNVVGMHRTLIETYYQLLNHTMSRHNSPWSASFEGQKAS